MTTDFANRIPIEILRSKTLASKFARLYCIMGESIYQSFSKKRLNRWLSLPILSAATFSAVALFILLNMKNACIGRLTHIFVSSLILAVPDRLKGSPEQCLQHPGAFACYENRPYRLRFRSPTFRHNLKRRDIRLIAAFLYSMICFWLLFIEIFFQIFHAVKLFPRENIPSEMSVSRRLTVDRSAQTERFYDRIGAKIELFGNDVGNLAVR